MHRDSSTISEFTKYMLTYFPFNLTIGFKLESKEIYLVEFVVKESPDLLSDPPVCNMVKLMGTSPPRP